jgi:hypothetical protein
MTLVGVIKLAGALFASWLVFAVGTWFAGLVIASRRAVRDLGEPTPEEARIHLAYDAKRDAVANKTAAEAEAVKTMSDAEAEEELNR